MSDALTQLRTALSPTRQMSRIPFPIGSYQHESLPLSAERLLNCYVEEEQANARSPTALMSTAGAVYRETLDGIGPVAAFDTSLVGGFYAVSGGQLYRNTNGTTVSLGTVGLPTDALITNANYLMTTIACSPSEVVVCVPPNCFTGAHDAVALTQLTPAINGFPASGALSVTYVDGYFVFTQTGRGTTFFWSPLAGGAIGPYDALSFANVESMDNILLRAITHRGELWFLGLAGIEAWKDVGNPDLPFRRISGSVIPLGVVPRSVAIADGSMFWVSFDGVVYRSNNYQPQRISTHPLETVLERANPDFALGMSYTMRGHIFYVLTLQDLGVTFSYDTVTKQWHDRSSAADGSGAWLGVVAGRIGEGTYVGDATGRLFTLDPTSPADDAVDVLRQATFPPVWAGTRRAFQARMEIEMEVSGPNPPGDQLLEWSDDGGYTWNGSRTLATNGILGRRTRVVSTRMGSFRQRVFRLSANQHVTWYAADGDIAPGSS